MNEGWISIDKVFAVECSECGLIDEVKNYKQARDRAAEHRRNVHKGDGVSIGGTWGSHMRSDQKTS